MTDDAAGMTADEIDQAHRALVQSASFSDAVASLPAELAQKVTDAAVHAFTDGVAQSMVATGILAVIATAIVAFLWPAHDQPDPPSDPT